MNITQLDTIIRRLSESEEGYRNGTKRSIWSEDALEGKEIPCLKYRYISNRISSHWDDNSSFYIVRPELNISINRNSRFNKVPKHTHDYIEISYMYDGSADEIIGSNKVTLKKGQVLILDTLTPHSVSVLGENDIMINVLMNRDYLYKTLFHQLSRDSILSEFFINVLRENNADNNYLHFLSENNSRVSMFFGELLCEACDPSINSSDIIIGLIMLIIAELINVYEGEQAKAQLKSKGASFIPILHYMEANFKTCTRENVAEVFHISEKQLTNLIKKNTGMTYKQLIQTQKLRYASKLLKNTELPISDVIIESGYENMNFFYKKFRMEYGVSPRDYRNGYKN